MATASTPLVLADQELDAFAAAAQRFVDAHPEEWTLDANCDLEVLNHVLRVHIQRGTIADHSALVLALVRNQHADGGWGDRRDDAVSRVRSTAFCAQMLLRADRALHEPEVTASAQRAVAYIVAKQLPDGTWRDDTWHPLDALSVSVGTLHFAVNEPWVDAVALRALRDGMAAVRAARAPDGLWYYRPGTSPVTISAHLLQKIVTDGSHGAEVDTSLRALVACQDPAGHYDGGNVDHTCDATRATMLAASVCADDALVGDVAAAATRALRWIVGQAAAGGLPDRPGKTPHVERTCDGIDTVLKYRRFMAETPSLVRYYR